MSIETILEQAGVSSDKLKSMLYIYQGNVIGDKRDWDEITSEEKSAFLQMYLFIRDELTVDIKDHDGSIVQQIKHAKNNNHGYMSICFMNPGCQEKFLNHTFSDTVDYDEFMYFWEEYGQKLAKDIYGKALMKSTKKFQTGDNSDDEFAGLNKIRWNRFDTMDDLPPFSKDPDSNSYYTEQVMAYDRFGNCEIGIFTKKGKKSKKAAWVSKSAMQKPAYWISQHKLIAEIAKKEKELNK